MSAPKMRGCDSCDCNCTPGAITIAAQCGFYGFPPLNVVPVEDFCEDDPDCVVYGGERYNHAPETRYLTMEVLWTVNDTRDLPGNPFSGTYKITKKIHPQYGDLWYDRTESSCGLLDQTVLAEDGTPTHTHTDPVTAQCDGIPDEPPFDPDGGPFYDDPTATYHRGHYDSGGYEWTKEVTLSDPWTRGDVEAMVAGMIDYTPIYDQRYTLCAGAEVVWFSLSEDTDPFPVRRISGLGLTFDRACPGGVRKSEGGAGPELSAKLWTGGVLQRSALGAAWWTCSALLADAVTACHQAIYQKGRWCGTEDVQEYIQPYNVTFGDFVTTGSPYTFDATPVCSGTIPANVLREFPVPASYSIHSTPCP